MQMVFNFLLIVAFGYLWLRYRSLHHQLEQLKRLPIHPSPADIGETPLVTIAQDALSQHPSPKFKTTSRPRSMAEWEFLIGGNIYARLGALAIVLSAGFALNYAFERNLITEYLRILLGFIVGFLFLAAAEWSNRKALTIFSQALVAIGVSTHYMTIYAMSQFYRMVPESLAMALMVVVAVVTVGLALYYTSQPIAIMASIGAYLVPVLFNNDTATAIPLLVYLLVISSAFKGLIWYKPSWKTLRIFPIAGVLILTTMWYTQHNMEWLLQELLLLGLMWILFVSHDLWNHLLQTDRKGFPDPWITSLTGCFVIIGVVSYMELQLDWTESMLPAAVAILYLVLVIGLKGSIEPGSVIPNIWSFFAGILSLFALFALNDEYIGVALAGALMLGMLFVRERWQQAPLIWAAGFLLVFNTIITMVMGSRTPQPDWLIVNSRTLTYLLMITGWLWIGFSTHPIPKLTDSNRKRLGGIIALAMGFIWLNVEVDTGFTRAFPINPLTGEAMIPAQTLSNWIELTRSSAWLLYSVFLFSIGVIRSAASPRYGAMLIFSLSIVKIFISDLSFLETPYRIISFLVLGLILLTVSFVYQRYRSDLFDK